MRRSLACLAMLFLLVPASTPSARPAPPASPTPRSARTFDGGRRCDINSLNLFVTNFGSIGLDVSTTNSGLFYPRGTSQSVLFAAGLWLGGRVADTTRTAIAEYSQDFAPGEMFGGAGDLPSRPEYKVWKVLPWRGNPLDTAHVDRTPEELATDPNMDPIAHHGWSEYMANAVPRGAPTHTWIMDDSLGGSTPVLGPEVLGSQMTWCVFNDADPARHLSLDGGRPLGVEVRQSVFALDGPSPLSQAAFVRWRITNRSGRMIDSLHVAFWLDPDLGGPTDDLVASDVYRGLGFAYNATNTDAVYGSTPPALGVDWLEPSNGSLYAFGRYTNGTDPAAHDEVWNILHGLLADGTAMYDPVQMAETRYAVSGVPELGIGWLDTNPGDRRMIIVRAPENLAPDNTTEAWAVILVARGTNRLNSISWLRTYDDAIQAMWDSGSLTAGTTPTLASLVSANAQADRVELEWRADAPGLVGIERRTEEEGWERRAQRYPDGAGRVVWVDEQVEPGRTYGYRLGLGDGGGAPYTSESWVTTPLATRLALAGFTPNPGVGRQVAFSLATFERASIEVLDLAGRRVLARDVTSLGPGSHELALEQRLAPGLYLLRLRQGDREVRARSVVIR